jgi:hypothetical protein
MKARKLAMARKTDKAMQKMRTTQDFPGSGGGDGGYPMMTPSSAMEYEYDDNLEKDLEQLEAEDDQPQDTGPETAQNSKQTQRAMKEQFLQMKEKKIVATRNSKVFHRGITLFQQRKLYMKLNFGFRANKDNSKNHTFILDWLVLGRKEIATNLQVLVKLGITHVLNVTTDVKNSFTKHFMYEKISVRDSDEEDIGKHFTRIIAFIKRCETCKGRVRAFISLLHSGFELLYYFLFL